MDSHRVANRDADFAAEFRPLRNDQSRGSASTMTTDHAAPLENGTGEVWSVDVLSPWMEKEAR